jgi:UDP:flavonoid glycosyltransferase YjiC (YdhE family)
VTTISWFGFPLRSHTVPSLPVVSALVRAGADVTFQTTPPYCAMVEATGARVVGYPAICEQIGREGHDKDLRSHVRNLAAISAAIVPSLVASFHTGGQAGLPPDLVVFDASAPWGRAVARECRTPSATSVTTFVFTRSMLQIIGDTPWMTADDIDVLATSGDLKVVYTSAMFQPAGTFLDNTHLFVGPLLESRPRDGVRVEPEGSRPLAYVSLGTVYNEDVALLQRIAAQLSSAGWQVVVSLGSASASAIGQCGEWPPHVRAYPFLDQLAVLAHARLVVSHGGLQTVTESLAAGVPLIVIPQDVDQHLVGRRTAGLGAAIVLDAQTVTTEDFAGALARIDAERSRFNEAAAAIGRSFAATMPLAAAVQRLLDLAEARRRSA